MWRDAWSLRRVHAGEGKGGAVTPASSHVEEENVCATRKSTGRKPGMRARNEGRKCGNRQGGVVSGLRTRAVRD